LEIVPGIHQIKLPLKDNPLGYVNTYLIQGTEGWVLLDTGWNDQESFEALSGQLKEIQVGFQDISLIIITHMHPDHIGQADRVQQLSGASLAVHEVEKEYLDSKLLWTTDLVFREINAWLRSNGVPEEQLTAEMNSSGEFKNLIPEASPDRAVSDGDTISTGIFDLQVIWTPGHSNGHICLYEPSKKLLFTGDHILPGITPNISIHMQSHEDPLRKYLKSLKKLQGLDMVLGLPAHEEPFTNLRKRIDELLAHHEERKAEIIEAIGSREKTAYHISSEITWMEGNVRWEDIALFDRRIAVTDQCLLRAFGNLDAGSSPLTLRSIHDDNSGECSFRYAIKFCVRSDWKNIPVCSSDHLEDIDADSFHRRPGPEIMPAVLSFQSGTGLMLYTKCMSARAGGKTDGQVMAVIECLRFNATDDFVNVEICCHQIFPGISTDPHNTGREILNKKYGFVVMAKHLSEFFGFERVGRAMRTYTIRNASGNLALQCDSLFYRDLIDINDGGLCGSQLNSHLFVFFKVLVTFCLIHR